MKNEKLERINFLAKKAKTEGLTEAEIAEQAELRKEYIGEFKRSLRSQLDSMYIVDAEGNKTKVKPKGEK